MSDYEAAQRRRDVIVGIFVIVGLAALGWMIFKFGDLPTAVTRMRSFEVYVQFPTAPGVEKDTPVRFAGYQIGRVTHVMAPEVRTDLNTGKEYHQTLCVLSINKKYVDIPCNVEVKLMTRGLGSSYLELKVDPSKLPAPPAGPERSLTPASSGTACCCQGSTGMTSEFFPEESQKMLNDLVTDIRTFIANANDILGDPNNKKNIKATLANLTDASGELDRGHEGGDPDDAGRQKGDGGFPHARLDRDRYAQERRRQGRDGSWSSHGQHQQRAEQGHLARCGWPWRRSTTATAPPAGSSTTAGSTRASSRAPRN